MPPARNAPVSQVATTTVPASTAPQTSVNLSLVTVNPYAYQHAVNRQEIFDLLAAALGLAVIGLVLIYRARLERAAARLIERHIPVRIRSLRGRREHRHS